MGEGPLLHTNLLIDHISAEKSSTQNVLIHTLMNLTIQAYERKTGSAHKMGREREKERARGHESESERARERKTAPPDFVKSLLSPLLNQKNESPHTIKRIHSNAYIEMYIFMFVCVFVYTCIHIYKWIYMYIYVYIHINLYAYAYTYINMYNYIFTHANVYKNIHICICIYV